MVITWKQTNDVLLLLDPAYYHKKQFSMLYKLEHFGWTMVGQPSALSKGGWLVVMESGGGSQSHFASHGIRKAKKSWIL